MNPDRFHTQALKVLLVFIVLLAVALGLAALGPDEVTPQDGTTLRQQRDTGATGSRHDAVESERAAKRGETLSR